MTALPFARSRGLAPVTLLVGFAAAVAVRVAIAGPAGASSVRAGLLFALALVVLTVAAGTGIALSARAMLVGLGAAAVLVLPVLVSRGVPHVHPAGSYLGWAAATAVVATAEEAFLRGALFDALTRWRGTDLAVAGSAIAFALLHVPLYGWHVLPLDLAVGVALGAVRLVTGTWTASAVAHVGADLVGWWLV